MVWLQRSSDLLGRPAHRQQVARGGRFLRPGEPNLDRPGAAAVIHSRAPLGSASRPRPCGQRKLRPARARGATRPRRKHSQRDNSGAQRETVGPASVPTLASQRRRRNRGATTNLVRPRGRSNTTERSRSPSDATSCGHRAAPETDRRAPTAGKSPRGRSKQRADATPNGWNNERCRLSHFETRGDNPAETTKPGGSIADRGPGRPRPPVGSRAEGLDRLPSQPDRLPRRSVSALPDGDHRSPAEAASEWGPEVLATMGDETDQQQHRRRPAEDRGTGDQRPRNRKAQPQNLNQTPRPQPHHPEYVYPLSPHHLFSKSDNNDPRLERFRTGCSFAAVWFWRCGFRVFARRATASGIEPRNCDTELP